MFVAVCYGMGSLLKGREGEGRGVCVCVCVKERGREKGKVKSSRGDREGEEGASILISPTASSISDVAAVV